jgi:hypothetical protein
MAQQKNVILSENSSWACKGMRPIKKLANIEVVETKSASTLPWMT